MIIVEAIPYKNFKQKIEVTKKLKNKVKILEIDNGFIYTERDIK
ncbi:hypothetical protein [Clostridium sp.]